MEDNPTARSRELGVGLRAAREAAGWTSSNKLAKHVGFSQATVSRLETGMRAPSKLNVATLLGASNVSRSERRAILELAEGGQDGCWVRQHNGILPEAVPSVVYQQDVADTIIFYGPLAIPAILQTTEHAELELLPRFDRDADAIPHLGARMDRHAVLHKWDSPDAVFYLHETTLRSMPVDDEVRVGQLLAMAMLSGQKQARIRIIPAAYDRTRFSVGSFQLLRFRGFPPLVCAPTETVTLILEGRKHIRAYEAILDDLTKVARSEQDSTDLITKLADELQRTLPHSASEPADE